MDTQKSLSPEHAETLAHTRFFTPAVDVYESKDDLRLVADIPGVNRDDLHIRVERNELVVEAKRAPDGTGTAVGRERRVGSFKRTFLLPQSVDVAAIEAELSLGVLTLRLPKSEASKPRRIEVKVGA